MKTNPKPILLGPLGFDQVWYLFLSVRQLVQLQLEMLLVTSKVCGELIFDGLAQQVKRLLLWVGFTPGCSKP